jgi:rubrerythrin
MTTTLNQKETSLLKDLRKQEQLCVDKFTQFSERACDEQLGSLFSKIAQDEKQHLDTLAQISGGTVPSMSAAGGQQKKAGGKNAFTKSPCSAAEKKQDKFLCDDALSNEKYISGDYNTCIFEFRDANIRQALNHIQKEEQEHGEQIYNYMSTNGMYQ